MSYHAFSEIFLDIGRLCPSSRQYRRLYPTSSLVRNSVCSYFISLLKFCKEVIRIAKGTSTSILLKNKLFIYSRCVRHPSPTLPLTSISHFYLTLCISFIPYLHQYIYLSTYCPYILLRNGQQPCCETIPWKE